MDSHGTAYARDYPARFYEQYYAKQSGGNSAILPHFRPQRGRGIFGKLFRGFVLPTLGKVGNVLKREAPKRLLSLGRDVIGDVVEGKSLGSSLKRRGLSHLEKAAGDILAPSTSKRARGAKRRRKVGQVGGRRGGGKRRGRKQTQSSHRRRRKRPGRFGAIGDSSSSSSSSRRRKARRGRRRRRTGLPSFSAGRDIFG